MSVARAVAAISAVVLGVCFVVVMACGRTYPNMAVAAVCVSFAALVVMLAALRRVFRTVTVSQPPGRRVRS